MELRRSVLLGVLVCQACGDPPPGETYFDHTIEPILRDNCAVNTSGCHTLTLDPPNPYQFAAGNLDVTSYAAIQKRRDVLVPFGAYPKPLLLIKAVAPDKPDPNDPNKLFLQYGDIAPGMPQFLPIDVLHAGGSIINVGSPAYLTLQTWMENGATENGLKPPSPAKVGSGGCSTSIPSGFNAATYTANPNFQAFKDDVQPIFDDHGCTSGNCHGAPQSDFYITCGSDDDQLAFNFSQAWSFVNNPVDDSQILRVPLAVSAGGRGHTGGDQFSDTDDGDFQTIRTWAQKVGLLDFAMGDPVKGFFKDNVQPILLQRGCSFQACHSPAATNDFKLRSGTQGFFSAVALEKNYELLLNEFMAVEYPDARRGRAVAKTVLPDDYRTTTVGGIVHRAKSVLETPGAMPADPTGASPGIGPCPTWVGNTPPASVTPFCVVQEWVNRERVALATQVTPMNTGDPIDIVYVDRPANDQRGRLELDPFQGGADLMRQPAQFGGNFGQGLATNGAPVSLLADASCAAIRNGDIQAPDVAFDGDRVVFAARANAGGTFGLWTVAISTGTCAQVTTGAPAGTHDFDPAWSPDGMQIVFASTRGKGGPSLSRKRFLPQSDLWRVPVAGGAPEQMTFLSNSEVSPQFMREGRVTMTTEKVSDGFYQLSGRRINWDLTDYHPLLAQRAQSHYGNVTEPQQQEMLQSIGFSSATDIREGNDGNFLLILSNVDQTTGVPAPRGAAGALAIFNRSIGPFERDRKDAGFLPSVTFLHAGDNGYRAPFLMPDGQIMVSHTTGGLNWGIDLLDPKTDVETNFIANGVDAVLAYKYPVRNMYKNRRQLVFGGTITTADPSHAVVHMPDAPMVFTVLTGNLRRGRPIELFRPAKFLAVFTEGKCPTGTSCAGNQASGIYQDRTMIGSAPLAADGSVKIQLPSGTGVVLELQDGNHMPIVTMGEEHQLGPGETISMGISERLFDTVCGGCHGSVSGHELDVNVSADALTGASASLSAGESPVSIGP